MKARNSFIENKKIYQRSIAEIKKAKEIVDKVDGLLPAGWESDYICGMWRGLLFSCSEKQSSLEFKLVCKLIEKATATKLKRNPWIEGKLLFCLKGETFVPISELHNLTVQVRMMNPTECTLEYEEKTVTVAKMSDDCLGLSGDGL